MKPDITKSKTSAIEITNLEVKYSEAIIALDNLTFSIPAGKSTALIGPNGAGKSTILKAITGLVKTSKGEIKIFGENYKNQRKNIAYMPQRASVDWNFPACASDIVQMGIDATRLANNTLLNSSFKSAISFFANKNFNKLQKQQDRSLVDECLERVDLLDLAQRQISELSGGQQQRLFLARSLAQQPQIYLLDEPFSALDINSTKKILGIFRELRDQGATILCAHHDMRLLETEFEYCVAVDRNLSSCGAPSKVIEQLRSSMLR